MSELALDHTAWTEPMLAAALFAVDPVGLQGILLRAQPGPVRDGWLQQLQQLLPAGTPWRRLPLHTGDDRLLGGLDFAATLVTGRPVVQTGLLAASHGGVLLLAMAERLTPAMAARLAAVLDSGEVAVERAGVSRRTPASLGMIALDEGIGDEEATPRALADRLAIHLGLDAGGLPDTPALPVSDAGIRAARQRLAAVRISDALVAALCQTALQLGIDSLRIPLLAVRVARAAAALDGEHQVTAQHGALAGRLVFACRVTQLPEAAPPPEQSEPLPEDEPAAPDSTADAAESTDSDRQPAETDEVTTPQTLPEQILQATRAVIPPQLLQQLRYAGGPRNSIRAAARSVARCRPARRGRRIGTRPGEPGTGAVLNLVETLRVAAPWQNLRWAESASPGAAGCLGAAGSIGAAGAPAVRLRRDDFRINRYQQRAAATTVFAVDASGSSALHRLAEAKAAVELLLAESYQRRDQVALVAFRGQQAELLLSPTRSLVRAKRSLAGLPGGGGTPLAAGIQLALDTALGIRHKGETPVMVLLTDGRANVTLAGQADRRQAANEALAAARAVRTEEITALLIDTSPRPRPQARELAEAMAACYLALPHADAEGVTHAARSVLAAGTESAGWSARRRAQPATAGSAPQSTRRAAQEAHG